MVQMIQFSCNSSDLRAALRHIRVALPKRKQDQVKARVEFSLKPDSITISVVGASYTIDSHSGLFVKIFMPVMLLSRAVRAAKSPKMAIECEPGKVRFNGMEVSSTAIEITHPENQSKLDLTINYNLRDILRLRKEHSIDEIERMGLYDKLIATEEKLEDDIMTAYHLLKPYGMTQREMKEWIEGKIGI